MNLNQRRGCGRRAIIQKKLHETYIIRQFDNSDIWAGNMSLHVGKKVFPSTLQRIFLDVNASDSAVEIRVSAELYIRGITDFAPISENEIDVVLWTDINRHGIIDRTGEHFPDFGYLVSMNIMRDPNGSPVMNGNNAVFISEPVRIEKTGVFSYTVEFSADDRETADRSKSWMCVNDIAHNQDGVIAVSPSSILDCPSVMEVCVRKYGARIENGAFISGTFENVSKDISNIPSDIIYLLPFFETGTGDIITGEDVRKGELGSIYAVKDFFRIDSALAGDISTADISYFVLNNLISDSDFTDIFGEKQQDSVVKVADIASFKSGKELVDLVGLDAAEQLVARARLRELMNAAHDAGKRVVFDLVLMQTSRDSRLIEDHIDWYELDDSGIPKIHSIAWLVYSDVALFRLKFNRPLQNYLSAVAPYWMRTCGLDGVRIDASQTVDRIFLKQIKNRINEVKPDAVIIAETLCPFEEALDIPADIIYSLLVDNHVNVNTATPYYDLFEKYHQMFPRGTHALAYFENHDSARATALWKAKFNEALELNDQSKENWDILHRVGVERIAEIATALKSLQCSMINMMSGTTDAVNFCYALENGTDFNETERTDFENPTLLNFSLRETGEGALLHRAYVSLHLLKQGLSILKHGSVFYMRDNMAALNNDRVFALCRHTDNEAYIFASNLDADNKRSGHYSLDFLPSSVSKCNRIEVLFDNYNALGFSSEYNIPMLNENEISFELMPLAALVLKIM